MFYFRLFLLCSGSGSRARPPVLRAAEWPREDTAEVAAMRRLPRGISLCLAGPEAVAGRGVVDGEIVAIVEAGGLYACRVAAGENLALVLNLHHVHGGLAIILFHCLVCSLFNDYLELRSSSFTFGNASSHFSHLITTFIPLLIYTPAREGLAERRRPSRVNHASEFVSFV